MKTYSAWTDQPGLERGKSKRATNKIMIVALAALILCFTWAKSGLAAQAAKPQKPPAPTAPGFTLLDNNGNQIGTVISFALTNTRSDGLATITRVSILDATGVTRNLALAFNWFSTPMIDPSFNLLVFESTDCSGAPFIAASSWPSGPNIGGLPGFLPAFDSYFLNYQGDLAISTSKSPQSIVARAD